MATDPTVAVLGNLLAVAHRLTAQTDPADISRQTVLLGAELVIGATVELERLMSNGETHLLASSRPADCDAIGRPQQGGDLMLTAPRLSSGPRFEFILGTTGRHRKRLSFQFAVDSCVTTEAWPLAAAFAAYADLLNDRASLLGEITHLREAVETNREIGAAVGVLMVRHGVT